MNRRNFLPATDTGLEQFTGNFGRIISANAALFGLTDAQVEGYETLQQTFGVRLTAAVDPATRGKRSVFLKDETRKELVSLTRKYAKQINNLVSVTNDQRQELGITIASGSRTPVPVPGVRPFIEVIKVEGRTVTIDLRQSKTKRGKPTKVAGATVFTYTGAIAPLTSDPWKFVTNTTKTLVEIPFGPSSMGETVWIAAFWSNSRDESGPASTPISVNLPAGGVLPQELADVMKLAA